MAELPDPPVPADVDLRGMDFIPLYGDRLFKSTTWLKSGHEARCAALRLWWHSFAHEVPASSLPDDDYLLAEYAGYGEVVKAWLKIKPQAMRGWKLCSDGRWYHQTVAELALEAWKGRVKNREKVRKWREKQAGGNPGGDGNSGDGVPVTGVGTKPPRNRREGKGQGEGQLQGEGKEDAAASSPPAAAREPGDPSAGGDQRPAAQPPSDAANPGASGDQPGDDLEIPPFLRRAQPPSQAAMAEHAETEAAFALWRDGATAEGWPEAGLLTSTRRYRLQAILAACGGIDGFAVALDKARGAKFLRDDRGQMHRWFDLDWLLDEQHFARLMEGRYDRERRGAATGGSNLSANLAALAEFGRTGVG